MSKKTIAQLQDLRGKRVLIRVDFNVPMDKQGNITNDRRIRSAVPTIETVLKAGGSAIVMSHLGRPSGDPEEDKRLRMDRIGTRLGELLNKSVTVADDFDDSMTSAAQSLKDGEVLLLQNLRFHPGEKEGDAKFASKLAALADVYVNDAFGTCHRQDASMVAVPAAMKGKPRVVGLLVAKELEILDQLLSNPDRPFLGILGGAKVSDKIGFIKAMLQQVDKVLIGGAMRYTFLKAQGKKIGTSKCENDKLHLAEELLELGGDKIILPIDSVVVEDIGKPEQAQVVEGDIPDHLGGVDIGPKSLEMFQKEIAQSKTVVWNGPMGIFEVDEYSKGTRGVADAMASLNGVTIVGGGETAEAVEVFGLAESMTHVSTGGGAFLEYVEGMPFVALEQIDEA